MSERNMADQVLTKQKLINADEDLGDLEEVLNGPPGKLIKTRLGREVYSLASVPQINTMTREEVTAAVAPKANKVDVDTALSNLSTTANKYYSTLAAANADIANIALNQSVTIGEEANGGLWYKATAEATSLTKSDYDPLRQAKSYADANGLFKPIVVLAGSTKHVNDYKTDGWYLFSTNSRAATAGVPTNTVGFLFVITQDGVVHQEYIAYQSTRKFTRTSNTIGVFPDFDEVITKKGLETELLEYVDIGNVSNYTNKPYDIVTDSKNLYDASKKQVGVYINNAGTIKAEVGWSCSDFIPVTAGEYYTISGIRQHYLAFYATKGGPGLTSVENNTSTESQLTVQVPFGANFLVVNIDSTTVTGTNVQIELGQAATPYEPGGTKYKIDASYLSTSISTKQTLKIEGDNASVTGVVDGVPISINLLLTKANTHSQSTVFNFTSDYVNDVLQRNLNDDVAPMRMDGTTIGANHGYQKSNLTLVGHGKTVADIGSVWTSGGKQYVIVDIVSNDVLSITSRSDNRAFALDTLTHVSGASNTASFTPTATESEQWYPAIRDRKLNCFVDDSQIDLSVDDTYNFKDTVSFLESYSIMKKSDIVEWLITNAGQDHANYNAVPAYTVSFGYTFDHECGCTIYFGGVGRKTVDLVDQMITQSIQLAQGNGVVYNYIPKAAEFTEGGFTYNFSQLENLYAKNPSVPLYLTAMRQEAGTNPIDRVVMLNDQVGYATGYLPILDAAPDVRPTNASRKYLEIRNGSLKLYPRLIDSASITQINEGDAFAAIAYRKYFKRSTDRTCKYVVRSECGDYLYLDWHAAKTDEIELPVDLIGREFEVIEKSSNVTLLSKFASNSILVKIDATKNYGYLVIKFK